MSSSTIAIPLSDQPTRSQKRRAPADTSNQRTPGWTERLVREGIQTWVKRMPDSIDYHDMWTEEHRAQSSSDDAAVRWTVDDASFFREVALGGSMGFAESYLRGHWRTSNLTELLRVLYRNLSRTGVDALPMARLGRFLGRLATGWKSNSRDRSRRQIAAHYDLSNEFFELFLDPTMMYSSAWFDSDSTTLHQASLAKLDRICSKLDLQSSDHVLEIGTGWGGFATRAAITRQCKVTTTTISQAQFRMAERRFREAGISDSVQLLNEDYRDLEGQYDKVVSIEMIEAVGERHLHSYFRQCASLLKPGGRLLIQAIVMPEERYEAYRRSTDFIQRYIFPGGFLPSIAAIQKAVGNTSSLRIQSLEDLSIHYARTLEAWRERFLQRIDDVRALGFDDRFIRMWEYYLCYCEAAFREQAVRVVQIVWDKPQQSRL